MRGPGRNFAVGAAPRALAVHRAAAGQHEVRRDVPDAGEGVEHLGGADDVHLAVTTALGERLGGAGLRRQVDDDVGPESASSSSQVVGLGDVADDELGGRRAARPGAPGVGCTWGCRLSRTTHRVGMLGQQVGQRAADEAGAAGDEHSAEFGLGMGPWRPIGWVGRRGRCGGARRAPGGDGETRSVHYSTPTGGRRPLVHQAVEPDSQEVQCLTEPFPDSTGVRRRPVGAVPHSHRRARADAGGARQLRAIGQTS